MLEELSIRGLGVIDDATVRWGPGFTVLSGETGAGKTMVLTALGLLTGAKADASLVRDGDTALSVEAIVTSIPGDVIDRVEDAGGVVEDDHVVVARTVTPQRSRAIVGGRTVPAALLADIGERIIAIHGQDDQVHLRRPAAQRDALDRFAGEKMAELLASHRAEWEALKTARAALTRFDEAADRIRERSAWLSRGLAAVDELQPLEGEDERLRAFIDRAQNVEGLREASAVALDAISGTSQAGGIDGVSVDRADGSSAASWLAVARKSVAARIDDDPALAEIGVRIDEAAITLDELAHDLGGYLTELEADPAALERALDRRGQLRDARRSWCDADPDALDGLAEVVDHADALLAWSAHVRSVIGDGDPDDRRRMLSEQVTTSQAAVDNRAAAIRKRRIAAAASLEKAVSSEIAALGMGSARIHITVEPDDHGPTGTDRVWFGLAAHVDASVVPIHRGASGGEMSRIMLGLEVVLAESDPVGTFVFDEVDAGVGGRAATEVGARLAQLARTAQVIVVTHLPQVAAFADAHVVVEKSSTGGVTSSDVVTLDDTARVRELARMLSGMEDSELGQAHAEELLNAAIARRQA